MREKYYSMTKRILFTMFFILLITIGIPIIINESYKIGGYITLWNAEDVLAYYGSVLSSVTAVGVLAVTIVFTRKQIQRESFLREEKEKWNKVDEIISKALMSINPLQVEQIVSEAIADTDIGVIQSKLQMYIVNAKQSLDTVKCNIDSTEIEAIQDYINSLVAAIGIFVSHAEEFRNQYERMWKLDPQYNEASQYIGQQSSVTVTCVDKQTDTSEKPYKEMLDIANHLKELALKTADLYNTTYQDLLDQKRDVFRKINSNLDQQADRILLWEYREGRKNANA